MKLIGALIVLFFLVFGFLCVWAGCEGAYELITEGVANRAELVFLWFMVAITFICGMLCFAVAPLIINEMD